MAPDDPGVLNLHAAARTLGLTPYAVGVLLLAVHRASDRAGKPVGIGVWCVIDGPDAVSAGESVAGRPACRGAQAVGEYPWTIRTTTE